MKQMVILAGGKGTRLKSRTGDHPKGMIRVCGKPVLEHQIELAQRYKFDDIRILAGYGYVEIVAHFGLGEKWGIPITYYVDKYLAGTTRALLCIYKDLAPTFFVMYGDEMVDVALDEMGFFHDYNKADATLFVHPTDHPEDSDLVEADQEDRIKKIYRDNLYGGGDACDLASAPLYVMQKQALTRWWRAIPTVKAPSIAGLISLMLDNGKRVFAYRSDEYIKDIGTPERYDSVCAEWEHRHDCQSHAI